MTTADKGDDSSGADRTAEPILRSQEEAVVSTAPVESGRVRIRKHVDHDVVRQEVDRMAEHASTDVVPALADDSGELLTHEDGSVSIPILEEEIVIQKRLVVKERLVVRKTAVTETETIEATLRRERVEIDADPAVADRVSTDTPADLER